MYLLLKTYKTNLIKEAWLLTGDYCHLDHLLALSQAQISCLITPLELIKEREMMYKTEVQPLCQSEILG